MVIRTKKPHCTVIGAGISGLSAAAVLAANGFPVRLLEKNNQPGGRARQFQADGFLFDMGPSWYWMPDIIEAFFRRFDRSVKDYYNLVRLDPSYQLIFENEEALLLPSAYEDLRAVFEQIERGAANQLDKFLTEARIKYHTAIPEFVHKPGLSPLEFCSIKILRSLFSLNILKSHSAHLRTFFKDPRLLKLLEFPVLFLGAKPTDAPAMYSLMNYADMILGSWYPMGGMYKLVEAMTTLNQELGVDLRLNDEVTAFQTGLTNIHTIKTRSTQHTSDIVVATADYHHIETRLLNQHQRNYSDSYWDRRKMAPSCLIYYLGINKKLPRLLHHNLFFDADYEAHSRSIYDKKEWPEHPLFYACCPSITDPAVAPEGMENLFLLVPVAAGQMDTEEIRNRYFDILIHRIEKFCRTSIRPHVVFQKSYAASDFIHDYHSYKGNAYGLANTLNQTAFLRPSIRNTKLRNLFFAGHLTVPGPGIPPAIISGQVTADYIIHNSSKYTS